MENENLIAAVDLGSNSFRLSVARVDPRGDHFQIYAIDRLKETVRLAAGLDSRNYLSPDAIERAVDVLKRFGERIQDFSTANVRAVATNTFRIAKNVNELLPLAEYALGFPIEIISGQEEARLIYSGVVHELPPSDESRLVVDIGGGSTEFIIGQHFDPKIVKSLPMGCVSFTKRYFPNGNATAAAFDKAILAAQQEVEVIAKAYRHIGWEQAYGSSGTAKAIVAVLEASGFSDKGITLEGMLKLKKAIIKYGSAKDPELKDLKVDRIEVLPAGLSIMIGLFKQLKIEQMNQGDGALRMGVLYDLVGRHSASDKRLETVHLFMKRYGINERQAQRVKEMALALYDEITPQKTSTTAEIRQILGWACDLHELGLAISQTSYHRHTAYVLGNADMPGFSTAEQKLLALIALSHQGHLNKMDLKQTKPELWHAMLSIRLAALFMRKRQQVHVEGLQVKVADRTIQLYINQKWLHDHPLTEYSLSIEKKEWKAEGFDFDIVPVKG